MVIQTTTQPTQADTRRLPIAVHRRPARWRTFAIFAIATAFGLAACHRGPPLPNPVESKDGVSYIPIDDTAFLIPEKTWLKGTARNSTDGMVCCITLHASVPDVQPWSPERDDQMYWYRGGPGKKLEIRIWGDRVDQHLHFHEVPHSLRWGSTFIEEPSDQAAQGLRRFRQLWTFNATPDEIEKYRKEWGDEQVDRLRSKAGTPMMDAVFYEFIENERVKYLIRCDDDHEGLFDACHLHFPWARTLMVDIYFIRDYIPDIVAMADKVSAKLREFEAAGLAYRAAKATTIQP